MAKILLVEDNEAILYNTKLFLEMNGYEVITAEDGLKALDTLQRFDSIPDIIISDIMMPNMDGYTFYQKVTENPDWAMIPFVFMSAKTSPEDVRFGKKLGVDDYVTKPYDEEDLLAIIKGKIKRNKKILSFKELYEEKLFPLLENEFQTMKSGEKQGHFLLLVEWDDKLGPHLTHNYPPMEESLINLDQIGQQLFNISSAIYGTDFFLSPEGTLLHVKQIKKDAYLFFNAVEDRTSRSGSHVIMLVVLAKKIHYLASLRIREQLKSISEAYLKQEDFDLEQSWKEIEGIL